MSPRLCIGIGGKETKRDRTVGRGRMLGCLLSFPFLSFLSPTPPTAGFYRFPPIPPIFDRLSPRTLDIILLSSLFFLLN